MALSAVFVFLFMRLGAGILPSSSWYRYFWGLRSAFSGAWGAYYTELFSRNSALSSGISFNGEESYPPLPFLQLQAWDPRQRGCRDLYGIHGSICGRRGHMDVPAGNLPEKEKAADK